MIRFILALLLIVSVSAQITPYPAIKNTASDVAATPIPGSTPTTALTVSMLGYSSINDGQGGFFYWDYASAAIASFDVILSSNPAYAVNGRWLRVVGSPVSFDAIASNGGSGTNINLFGTTYISNGSIQTANFIDGAQLSYDQRSSFFAGNTDNAASQEFVAQQTPLVVTNIATLLSLPHPVRGQYAEVVTGEFNGTWQYCPDESTADNAYNIRRPDDIPTDADMGRWVWMRGRLDSNTQYTLPFNPEVNTNVVLINKSTNLFSANSNLLFQVINQIYSGTVTNIAELVSNDAMTNVPVVNVLAYYDPSNTNDHGGGR